MQGVRIDEIDGIWPYLRSLDWSDPWILILLALHCILILITVTTVAYNLFNVQILIFFILLSTVYSSEYINEWAANNWKLFSRQQYFDSNGLFISLLFSVPLLMNCLIIVMFWLWNSGNLMAGLKRAKLRQRVKVQKEQEQEQESKKDS